MIEAPCYSRQCNRFGQHQRAGTLGRRGFLRRAPVRNQENQREHHAKQTNPLHEVISIPPSLRLRSRDGAGKLYSNALDASKAPMIEADSSTLRILLLLPPTGGLREIPFRS